MGDAGSDGGGGDRKRRHLDRDPVADWRCPDCGFVNYARYRNATCHKCAKPKPEEEDLLDAYDEEVRRADARGGKRARLAGGEAERQLREEMDEELATAKSFLNEWTAKIDDTVDYQRKLDDMMDALTSAAQIEEELQSRHIAGEHDQDYAALALSAAEFLKEIVVPRPP